MNRYLSVFLLSCVAASAQDLSSVPLEVIRQADDSAVLKLQNKTTSRIVAYLILSKESIRTLGGKTIITEGGALRDAALDPFVSAIGEGETSEVLRSPGRTRDEIEHRTEFDLAAVLFADGKAIGREPFLTELRERREFTNRAAKGVLEILSEAKTKPLPPGEVTGRLNRLKAGLLASATSAGGKRLCEAFISDVVKQIDAATAEPDEAKRTAALARALFSNTKAQEFRLNRLREWGVQ